LTILRKINSDNHSDLINELHLIMMFMLQLCLCLETRYV